MALAADSHFFPGLQVVQPSELELVERWPQSITAHGNIAAPLHRQQPQEQLSNRQQLPPYVDQDSSYEALLAKGGSAPHGVGAGGSMQPQKARTQH